MIEKLIVIFLLLSLILPIIPVNSQSTVVISSWGWGTPQNPIRAHPGYNDTPFYVLVSQPIGYQIVYAYLILSGTPITSEGGSSIAYGSVTSTSLTTSQITFFLNVNDNAEPGTYNVPLVVVYQNAVNGAESQIIQEITIPIYNVTFPVLAQVFWGTTQQLIFAQVGEGLLPLTFSVFNPTTEPMLNVTLNVFLPKGIFSQTGSRELTVTIPALPAGEPIFVSSIVNVSNLVKPGVYTLNYSFSFMNFLEYFYKQYLNRSVNITIYPQAKINIYSDPIQSTPDNITTLIVTISTNVSSFIISVRPELPSNFLPISSNFTPSFLSPGQRIIYAFKIYIPQGVIPSIYPIPIEVNYTALDQKLTIAYLTYANIYYNETPRIVEAIWNTTITPFPGIGTIPLTLVIYNPLPIPITAVNITYTFPNGIFPLQPFIFLPGIPQYSSIPITIPVEITPNTSVGLLNFTYKISYNQDKSVDGVNSIYVLPPAPVIIEANQTVIGDGEYALVPIRVVNLGVEYVYNVNLIPITQGLEIITSVNNTIPFIKPNSSVTFYYTLYAPQGLPPAVYPLVIKLTYTYFTNEIVRTFTIPVLVSSSQSPILISFLKTTVYYNTNNTEILTIQNLANFTIYNIRLDLNYPSQEIYLSQNQLYIPYLPSHFIYTVPLYVIPQIPQTMSIPIVVTLNYVLGQGSPQTYQYQLNLLSTGFVKMEITQVSAQIVNNTVVINGLLINTGSQNAQYVTISVNNYSSIYIGNVPPNSPTPFSFTLTLPPGLYKFNITANYENELYQPNMTYYVLSYVVSYPTSTNSQDKIPVTTVLLIAVIITLLVIIIYLSLRGLRK
ncbi:COG1361 S-layer family protein [Sulfolobus sp. E11-6]|uniref:COG1361 S-layer family protein n=1 Tax=Sulfolobus sp. E11-6 TaxID=2663020 RepID=UPI0012979D70|nr:COG1361 S-layer family protein [Sulfolobus sp. E11-6]QGA69311.1 hypothetical protein GFS33_11955 [Sulfolobus sp. E11-6]